MLLIAMILITASAPIAFSTMWTRRWFKICWSIVMMFLVSTWIFTRLYPIAATAQ